jgi:hypothetical protein
LLQVRSAQRIRLRCVATSSRQVGSPSRSPQGEGWNHHPSQRFFSLQPREDISMARKYSKKASAKVERAMKKRKAVTLKSGRSGRKVKSRKQAIAIGLSEARAEGKKVPKKRSGKKAAKKKKAKKSKR